MILYEQGLEYWRIAKRCHHNRDIMPTAVRDMERLLGTERSEPVRKRIASFIARNRPGKSPNDSGPRYA